MFKSKSKVVLRTAAAALVAASIVAMPMPASAAALTSMTVTQTEARPSMSSTHTVTLSGASATPIACIRVNYSRNSDMTGATGLVNTGATISGSIMASYTGWDTYGRSTDQIQLTRSAGTAAPDTTANRTVVVGTVTNGTAGVFYVTVRTYSDNTCTTLVDSGVTASSWTDGTSVTLGVLPTLAFTVSGYASQCNGQSATNFRTNATGTSVALGNIGPNQQAGAAQELAVTSNAANGYSVRLHTPGTTPNVMRSGSNFISDVSGSFGSPVAFPGSGSAFGYTVAQTSATAGAVLTANTFAAVTGTPQALQSPTGPLNDRRICVGYQVRADALTPTGTYTATIVYSVVPNF